MNNRDEAESLFIRGNISSSFALSAVILSMQANYVEYQALIKENVEFTSDQLTIMALYLLLISILIDLSIAKEALDDLQSSTSEIDPLEYDIAISLLISRLLSVASWFFLIKSVYKATDLKKQTGTQTLIPNIVVPT